MSNQDANVAQRDQLPSGPKLYFYSLKSLLNVGERPRVIRHAKQENRVALPGRPRHATKLPRTLVHPLGKEALPMRTPEEVSPSCSLSENKTYHLMPCDVEVEKILSQSGDL